MQKKTNKNIENWKKIYKSIQERFHKGKIFLRIRFVWIQKIDWDLEGKSNIDQKRYFWFCFPHHICLMLGRSQQSWSIERIFLCQDYSLKRGYERHQKLKGNTNGIPIPWSEGLEDQFWKKNH